MGSEKRERQKTARMLKIEAEEREARRARTRRRAVQGIVAAVVIVGGLFLYTLVFSDDDGDETAAEDETADAVECTTADSPADLPDDPADREAPDPEPPAENTPATALDCETLFPGEGDGAAAGDVVRVNYVGKIADDTVFDSSWQEGREPIEVTLGQGSVIRGWDEGLIGARVGERRRLVIGSENAYGAQPPQGSPIPPDSPLAFEVDIVEIITAEEAATTSTTAPAPPPESSTTAPATPDSSTTSAP